MKRVAENIGEGVASIAETAATGSLQPPGKRGEHLHYDQNGP